jgi:hypothetical protein
MRVEHRYLSFARVGDERWEAIDGALTRYVFGVQRVNHLLAWNRVFRWHLSAVVDGNGNWAQYVYRPGGLQAPGTVRLERVLGILLPVRFEVKLEYSPQQANPAPDRIFGKGNRAFRPHASGARANNH